ncbi:hypothetical protein E2C01_049711 [Portunus trituberculatus]|uniref:Uncharacterized protein n=1 Tax=Portunus trituberculatus TaxID=210409 RepID=A0A5B7GEJ4_PORTR|nr:hypothetical protein [Portunus trituberculatus]
MRRSYRERQRRVAGQQVLRTLRSFRGPGEDEPCDWARSEEAVIVLAGEQVLLLRFHDILTRPRARVMDPKRNDELSGNLRCMSVLVSMVLVGSGRHVARHASFMTYTAMGTYPRL